MPGSDSGSAEGASYECERQPFADELPIAEASGAVFVADAGNPHLLVAGDSGTNGAMLVVDPATGEVLASDNLPLDEGASDDLEGLAVSGDTIYAITSSGWMRHYGVKAGGALTLTEASYPIGDGDLVCDSPTDTNCAANYEGLCVRNGSAPVGACVGYAASKARGILYCLERDPAGRLRVDRERQIEVASDEALTGCEFAPDTGELWAGTNLFGMSTVYVIDEASGSVTPVGMLGRGFPEAIAVGPRGRVYRFSDVGSAPSLVDLYACRKASK